jgi:hypothetical protein
MIDEELLIATNGAEAVRLAKELSDNCPTGYFIVEDHSSNSIYYKCSDPPHYIIKTPYTADHVRIAHRSFLPQHTHHIRWDQLNSQVSNGKRDYYIPKENLANGLSAVKAELVKEFRVSEFAESPDIDIGTTNLRFDAEGRHFTVKVSDNFNDDYASGQIRIRLKDLASFLRESSTGRAFITSKGIE